MGAGGERTTRANPLERARALLRAQAGATPSAVDTEVEATEADLPEPSAHDDPPARPRLRASGRLLGRYVIRRKLGSGGMGLVYLADDPALQRQLAIRSSDRDCPATRRATASCTRPRRWRASSTRT